MDYDKLADEYTKRVAELGPKYDSLAFDSVHQSVLDLLPPAPALVLDVGAGSGRDAAWFAAHGYEVVAAEPAAGMLKYAKNNHAHAKIQWIQDRLPALENCFKLGVSFDLILVSAVWMHIKPDERGRAFRKLVTLLRPGGMLIISLRHGPMSDGFTAFPVSVHELEVLATQHGIAAIRTATSGDQLKREGVFWETVVLRLPDDGTEALPLLRHTILNDKKSASYKLALIRCLVRIADGAAGACATGDGDGYVSIPLGLVALYWIRMYKPLIEHSLPQMRKTKDGKSLGFLTDAFRSLKCISVHDLRIGSRFVGQDAESLHKALADCRKTIHDMPVKHITYPNSDDLVFKTHRLPPGAAPQELVLDQDYLMSFGEFRVPEHLWVTMSRFACWIEPSLISEWMLLMKDYARSYDKLLDVEIARKALEWLDPDRETNGIRTIAQTLFESGESIFCVWSGRKLAPDKFDVDHCFPFSSWPCNDLWNLLPTDPRENNKKSDKLVTIETLEHGRERIYHWWQRAYLADNVRCLRERFLDEARASLPVVALTSDDCAEAVFEGLVLKRIALKRNLQLKDWTKK